MTYEEIKNKLSICEKALNSIKTGGYKNQTKKNTQLKIQELRTLKEGLEKKLAESTQEESVAKLIQDHYRNPNTGVSMISDRIVSEYFRTHKDWDQDGKWDGTEEGNERGMDDFNEFFGANYGYMFPSAGDIDEQEGVVQTDDESKAEKLAKKGINVKLTEQDKGVQFGQNETAAIAMEVGKATAKALLAVGEELASMKGIRIRPNSFDIKAVFKGEKGEEEFSFYIEDDTLHLNDMSFDKEIADVGVMPSGKPLVNVDVIANELQKHFRSLSEVNERESYDANDDLNSMDFSKLNSGQKAAFDVWIVQYAEGYFDNKAELQGMIDKFAEVENAYDLEDFVHADFAGDKGERQIFIRQLIKAYLDDDQPLDEGEGDDHHYLKVPRTQYKKAQSVIDDVLRNDIYGGHKHDIVDNDGKGNVIFYFMGPEEKAITYDAVVYLRNSDVDVVDSSVSDIDEMDANDPVLMRLRANALKKKKNSERHNFDPRGIDQEEAMDLRIRLKDLEEEREDILRNMEQEAEPEGGPIADDYGSILNDIDEKIYKIKKQIDQYDMNESPMTMAYTKIVKGKGKNEAMEGSVSKLKKAHSMIVNKMQSFAKLYKEKGGDHIFKSHKGEENKVIDILKDLNDKKKKVEVALDNKVANIGKGQELTELSIDKEDALDELRDILGRVNDLGDQAREIIKQEFPSYLSKGDSYGVFNMGSSTNRYDTTLESMIDGIEKYYDEEEDELDEADLDKGEKKKLKDMSKSLKKSSKGHAGQAKYIDKLVKEDDKEIEHDCANHVLHEKYGHGLCLEGQHTLLEDGTVTHYDVFFKEGSKRVKNIPLNELKVITSSHHGHKRRKK